MKTSGFEVVTTLYVCTDRKTKVETIVPGEDEIAQKLAELGFEIGEDQRLLDDPAATDAERALARQRIRVQRGLIHQLEVIRDRFLPTAEERIYTFLLPDAVEYIAACDRARSEKDGMVNRDQLWLGLVQSCLRPKPSKPLPSHIARALGVFLDMAINSDPLYLRFQ